MSDLYLVLRSRLQEVTDWVLLESKTMRAAREGLGLSYETVARRIHVSSKTYERYEKAGRVPRQLLAEVAEALRLEVEEPARTRVTVATQEAAVVDERLEVMEGLLRQVLSEVQARPRSEPRGTRSG